MPNISPALLSDRELLNETGRVVARARQTTAELLALLAEIDARRLYLGEGYSSLFTYCTQALHLSEPAAYSRITAARAARRFPVILTLLADGSVTLTTISLLAAHLTDENHGALLEAARHKSKRDVERLIACLTPQPDIPASVRKLAAGRPESRREARFTNGSGTYPEPRTKPRDDLLTGADEARYGDLAAIVDRALIVLVEQLEKTKLAATHLRRPRGGGPQKPRGRHVPAVVKRAVWARDEGRCTFVGADGRCRETGFLEFHHVVPYAAGGATDVENLLLRCRPHNAYEAAREFGDWRLRCPAPSSGTS